MPRGADKPRRLARSSTGEPQRALLLTRALLPLLRKSTAGRILLTSSSVGRKGRAFGEHTR